MSNLMTRRNATHSTMLVIASGGVLAACASASNPTGVAPPSLAQLQAWLPGVVNELPSIEATLLSSGTLKAADKPNFDKAIAAAQAELPNLMALTPTSGNAAAIIQVIGSALTTAAGFVPAALPYAPLIGLAVMLVEGYINSQPTPVPVPPTPPAPAAVHAAATMRRR